MAQFDIDSLDFFEEDIDDVLKEQKEEQEPVVKKTEKPAPENFDEDEEDESPNNPEEEEEENEGINVFTAIVKTLNQKGITELPETEEYDEDTFVDALYAQAKSTVLQDLGLEDERAQKVLRYISSGGDLTRISEFYSVNAVPERDINDPQVQEQVVIREYQRKGLSSKRIANIIQDLKDDGELEDEAREIDEREKEAFNKREAEFIKQQENAKKQAEDREREYKKTFEKVLEKNSDFYGVEVTSQQRKQLKDWLNKPQEYKHTDGKTYKLTNAQIKQMELQNDPEKYAEFTLAVQFMLMNNFSNPSREAKIKTKTTKDIWDKVKMPSGGKSSRSIIPKEKIDEYSFN